MIYINRYNEEIKLLYLKDGFNREYEKFSNTSNKLKIFYNKYIKGKFSDYSYTSFKNEIKSFIKNAVIVYNLPKKNKEKSNMAQQNIIFPKSEIKILGTCMFATKQL